MPYKISIILLFFLLFNQNLLAQIEEEIPSGDLSTPKEAAFQHLYYVDENHYDINKAAAAFLGPGKPITAEVKDYVTKLKQIYDGKGLIFRVDLIPDDAEYVDSTSGNPVYIPFPKDLPEVYLIRPILKKEKKNRTYANYWIYSPETQSRILAIHREVYPLGSHFLLELMPRGGRKFLGLEAWQYLAMLVLIGIGILLNFITWRGLNFILRILANTQLGQDHFDPNIIEKIAHTISYMVVSYMFLVFIPVLMLPAAYSFYFLSFIKVFNTISMVLILLNIVELVRSYFKTIVSNTESTSDDQLLPIFIRTIKTIIIIIGSIYVLDIFDVDITALIAGLSIGGLALALAAQDTVKHLIGSVMIYADKPFKLGDFIILGDVTGVVEDVGFRSTRIRTPEGNLVSLPNGALVDMTVVNRGHSRFRRFKITIGVAYYTPVDLVEKFVEGLRTIHNTHPETNKENYNIHLNNMGSSALEILFNININANDFANDLKIREEIIFSILRLAKTLNVHVAFPSTSVYIETMPEKKGRVPSYLPNEIAESEVNMQKFLEEFRKKYPDKI